MKGKEKEAHEQVKRRLLKEMNLKKRLREGSFKRRLIKRRMPKRGLREIISRNGKENLTRK